MSIKVPPIPIHESHLFTWVTGLFSYVVGSDMDATYTFDSGPWDMQSNQTLSVNIGKLNHQQIDSISVMILKDGNTSKHGFFGENGVKIEGSTITLTRASSSIFNSSDFSNSTQNRARIKIWI